MMDMSHGTGNERSTRGILALCPRVLDLSTSSAQARVGQESRRASRKAGEHAGGEAYLTIKRGRAPGPSLRGPWDREGGRRCAEGAHDTHFESLEKQIQ